jgi:hypothetical protein
MNLDTICLNDVKTLIAKTGGVHISIYMPTHHRGGEDPQDPIRLKNLVRTAENKLIAYGLRPAEARFLLSPAELLLTDNLFWRQQGDGLAIFVESNQIKYYHLPISVKEDVSVSERYYIKPLIPLISECGWFYVLAISRHENRLLQCTSTGSVRINLGEIPRHMPEIIADATGNYRPPARPAQQPAGTMAVDSQFQTGESNQPFSEKRIILKYFDQLSMGINRILNDEKTPVVLASLDLFQSMYREVSVHHNLLPQFITGNPDGMSDESLRREAWTLVQPYFEKLQSDAINEFNKSAGTGFTVSGIKDVISAAYEGRVRFLFMVGDEQCWGTYDVANQVYREHVRTEPKDEDLMELAAIHTLNHAGTIYVIKPEEVPGRTPLSAILRY